MKFLVDAQLPPALAAWLRGKGHQALAVRDAGLRDASDSAIWSHAIATGSIVVTKDEDFALLAARFPGPTVLWVRVGNLTNRSLLSCFERAWSQVETYLEDGPRIVELRP